MTPDEIKEFLSSRVPFLQTLGLQLEELSPQGARLRIPFHAGHQNHSGNLHAGAQFTAVESCALALGFASLATDPASAAAQADAARKAERKVEKAYRRAIAELFQGDDYINMFKRREIYRHLSNAADRMANCANTLHDIVVKMC